MKNSRLHLGAALVWILLAIPTMLWWRESVPWLVFMSLYTIIVDHLGSYEAAKAKENADAR